MIVALPLPVNGKLVPGPASPPARASRVPCGRHGSPVNSSDCAPCRRSSAPKSVGRRVDKTGGTNRRLGAPAAAGTATGAMRDPGASGRSAQRSGEPAPIRRRPSLRRPATLSPPRRPLGRGPSPGSGSGSSGARQPRDALSSRRGPRREAEHTESESLGKPTMRASSSDHRLCCSRQ